MKTLFISTLLYFTIFSTFAQIKVAGKVLDEDNNALFGAMLKEINTENSTNTDIEGNFQINTLHSPTSIAVSFIGLSPEEIGINSDSIITVVLKYPDYKTKWITLGTSYDFINSKIGLQFSNGFDERPLIHFEDFSDKFIYKAEGQYNFKNDYSLGASIGWLYPTKHVVLIAMDYNQYEYSFKNHLFYKSIGVFANTLINPLQSELILKATFQRLNEKDNFGIHLGLQKEFLDNRFYAGFVSGYYFDYWMHSAFIQGFIYKKQIGMRLSYDKISTYDFFKLGISYSFNYN